MFFFRIVSAAGKEPVVLAGLSNVNVNSGKSAKLECDVVFGKPKAEVKWLDFSAGHVAIHCSREIDQFCSLHAVYVVQPFYSHWCSADGTWTIIMCTLTLLVGRQEEHSACENLSDEVLV